MATIKVKNSNNEWVDVALANTKGTVEPIVLTGDCGYIGSGKLASNYIVMYGDTITTEDITDADYMFYKFQGDTIPFSLNFKDKSNVNMSHMFRESPNLKSIQDMTYKGSSYSNLDNAFYSCRSLEKVPYIYNAYPSSMDSLFSGCYNLKEIPEDYFDTWNFDRIINYKYSKLSSLFSTARALRTFPTKFFTYISGCITDSTYSTVYYACFSYCRSLNEILDLPVYIANFNSNIFYNTFQECRRLKNITFSMNEDGTVKTANWKGQTIDLTTIGGFSYSTSNSSENWNSRELNGAIDSSEILKNNNGITADKAIYNTTTYQELKNDPDAFCLNSSNDNYGYSRYNHDSAVNTINSLPDTSAYLATAGGTNVIKFRGALGNKTDGGAINTLTEEEIAVAAAKGWSVAFV